ncbi:AAA family ATPase [Pseudonocardia sp. HH130629-09]|uniref:AAA family ATPase n=1 Tax=Pseudonocardia sp. HH130629-09 TaxID=1641402 RepID=UPI0006CB2FF8|nr:AAA family ATPase [Pseudonocardia sp. HH130629-09]ALE86043.1 shikimate kinase [Pseudonocardia sp. HH130629-09]
MLRVLITGMSGTGKTSALEMLGERGHRIVDTDTDEWSRWTTDRDGSSDWIWREDAMTELLTGHTEGKLFVSGCKTNQVNFYHLFEHIALLSAPVEIMLERITSRSNNPYGKSAEEREAIIENHAFVEPLLRRSATVEIDTSTALDEVVRRLDDLAAPRS